MVRAINTLGGEIAFATRLFLFKQRTKPFTSLQPNHVELNQFYGSMLGIKLKQFSQKRQRSTQSMPPNRITCANK